MNAKNFVSRSLRVKQSKKDMKKVRFKVNFQNTEKRSVSLKNSKSLQFKEKRIKWPWNKINLIISNRSDHRFSLAALTVFQEEIFVASE